MLRTCLGSVVDLADEIVVVDGESTDETVAIAREFGAKVVSTTNKANFHINKQMAIDACSGELILQLDADEVLDWGLKQFIKSVAADKDRDTAAWQVKRRNLFFGRWLQKGGQYPDMVIRLFWRDKARLPAKDVHEQMVVDGDLGIAEGHLWHYANPDLETYWRKFNTYTSFKATQLAAEKLPVNATTFMRYIIWKPLATWASLFLRHRGYVDGLAGFLFAAYSGAHHRIAYLKYRENLHGANSGKIRLCFPESRFAKVQAQRGVGRYGRWLMESLLTSNEVELVKEPREADVIHYTFFDLFFAGLKLVAPKKTVVTVHDVIPLLYPAQYPVGWRGKWHFRQQLKRLRKVALVVTDSEASRMDIVKYLKIKPAKVKVVALAGNPALNVPSASEVARVTRKYKLPKNYLLYVGDINYNKNLPQLIKAMKFLPKSLHLVLVGKSFREQDIPERQMIEEQCYLSEVNERVHLVTQVDDDVDLAAIYGGARCYVQPSLAEGFGLPVLEAMSCGTPLVCSDIEVFHEVAGEAAVYAQPRAAQFTEAVEKVLAMKESERAKLIAVGVARAKKFTWKKTAATMLDIYAQLSDWG